MRSKRRVICFIGLSIFLQSFSFLSIKYSTLSTGWWVGIFIFLAFFFLFIRAIVWQYILKTEELSKIYPYSALVQVLILGYAILLFGETAHWNQFVGLFFMIMGTLLISKKPEAQ